MRGAHAKLTRRAIERRRRTTPTWLEDAAGVGAASKPPVAPSGCDRGRGLRFKLNVSKSECARKLRHEAPVKGLTNIVL